RIVPQALGVIDILVSGKTTEYRLPQQTNQRVASFWMLLLSSLAEERQRRKRAEAPKETRAPEAGTSAQFIASETKRRSGPRNPCTKSGGDRTGNPRGLYPLDEARTAGLW